MSEKIKATSGSFGSGTYKYTMREDGRIEATPKRYKTRRLDFEEEVDALVYKYFYTYEETIEALSRIIHNYSKEALNISKQEDIEEEQDKQWYLDNEGGEV